MQANAAAVNMTQEVVPRTPSDEKEDVPRSTGQAALPEDDSCQPDQALEGMEVDAAVAMQEVQEDSEVPEPEEAREEPIMESAEVEEEQAPQRTESQRVKALKVEKVCKDVDGLRQPVADLNRSTSEMCGTDTSHLENADVQRLQEELVMVDQAQKKARNFGEDLVERMLALDNLSNLAKEDRAARKVAIEGIEGLLQQVDTTKARLQSMKRDMEQRIEKGMEAHQQPVPQQTGSNLSSHSPEQQPLPQTGTSSSHRTYAEPKREVNSSPPFPPVEAWKGLKLPVQFHAAEEQGRYVIQANIPGLDPNAVEARLDAHSDTLTIRGFRAPTQAEAELMMETLFAKLARSPYVRQLLQKNSVEACLKLGEGKYGSFSQTFAVPADVRADRISLDCVDGVLQVQLPKRRTIPHSARARPMSYQAPVGSYYADPWQRRRAPMPGLFGSFGGVY